MATDYTALDAAILAAIGEASPLLFSTLMAAVKKEADALKHTEKNGEAFRVADRRLQALRKAGRIRYQRKPEGWVLVSGGAA